MWASHGLSGFYLGPAILHYRSHHVFVTATSATRITDTVAWFPETYITPPLPDTNEILIATIKDLLHAIKKYHLTGEIISPTLAQELQDLQNCTTLLPPTYHLRRKLVQKKGWYYQKKTLCRKKGWCYCSGSPKPSSHHSSGPANGSPTTTKHLPTTARLACRLFQTRIARII